MSEPLVSVIICTIREDPRLDLTLNCMLQQTYKHFEVIYVDAIKDKRSPEFLKQASVFEHVQDKPWAGMGKRPGISSARNTGILYARGDIICVTGDNTYVQPDWIKRHVELVQNGNFISVSPCCNVTEEVEPYSTFTLQKHKEHPTKVTVHSNFMGYEKDYEAPTDCRLPGLPDEIFFGKQPYVQVPGGYLHGVSFALKLDQWLSVNGMDENFDKKGYGFEDCNFGVRLSRNRNHLCLDTSNWVISINDEKNPTLNKMFGTSGEANAKLWEASANDPIVANDNFNLRKLRENLKWYL
jgi:glycosyltransferase involved in cell wall biosynthesis